MSTTNFAFSNLELFVKRFFFVLDLARKPRSHKEEIAEAIQKPHDDRVDLGHPNTTAPNSGPGRSRQAIRFVFRLVGTQPARHGGKRIPIPLRHCARVLFEGRPEGTTKLVIGGNCSSMVSMSSSCNVKSENMFIPTSSATCDSANAARAIRASLEPLSGVAIWDPTSNRRD